MKYIIIPVIAFSIFTFFSCKKNATCECIITYSGSAYAFPEKDTVITVYPKITKSELERVCSDTKKNYDHSLKSSAITLPGVFNKEISCTIK